MSKDQNIDTLGKMTGPTLLGPDDPDPCTVKRGTSPLIIAGPHNGYHVPKSLYIENHPLGLHGSCFDPKSPFKRHEACDWGVEDLFKGLQELDKETGKPHNYVAGNYSRLVCDLNRTTELSITRNSDETGMLIPRNENIDEAEEAQRLSDIYSPYHHLLRTLVSETRERFGYAIFLDLHSYTPVWDGSERLIHVSTTACSDHEVERFVAGHLEKTCSKHDLRFAQHEPYDLKSMPNLAATAHKIEEIGVWYTGLELRNDLFECPDYMQNIIRAVHDMCTKLVEHHDTKIFEKTPETEKA